MAHVELICRVIQSFFILLVKNKTRNNLLSKFVIFKESTQFGQTNLNDSKYFNFLKFVLSVFVYLNDLFLFIMQISFSRYITLKSILFTTTERIIVIKQAYILTLPTHFETDESACLVLKPTLD